MSWVIFTILAAILQSFRNLEQKSLNKRLDALTVSWSRFIIPLPFAIIVAVSSFYQLDNEFIFHCFVTGLFQIAGNVFLLQTFKTRNFSIGIAFSKTEVLQSFLYHFNLKTPTYLQIPKTISSVKFLINSQTSSSRFFNVSKTLFLMVLSLINLHNLSTGLSSLQYGGSRIILIFFGNIFWNNQIL